MPTHTYVNIANAPAVSCQFFLIFLFCVVIPEIIFFIFFGFFYFLYYTVNGID